MSATLWQCTLYDDCTEYGYADKKIYRTREEAEKRAERMTSTEDGIDYWAYVHEVEACWKEDE